MIFHGFGRNPDYSDRILKYNCNFSGMQLRSTILTSKPLEHFAFHLVLHQDTLIEQSQNSCNTAINIIAYLQLLPNTRLYNLNY